MDHHLSHLSTRFKTPDPQSTRKRSGSQMQERQDRFFIKTLSPFLIQSGMRRAVGGKPVIRGYWIVIGCNAGQGSYNAGQGSNRILPNCPFCQRHNPPARFHHPPETSRIRLVTSRLRINSAVGVLQNFPKLKRWRWWYKYFLFRRGNKSTE